MKNCLSFLRNLSCAFFEHPLLPGRQASDVQPSLRGKATAAEAIQKSTPLKRRTQKTLSKYIFPGLPHSRRSLAMTCGKSTQNPVGQALPDNSKKCSFSLVEMLMALLVASLLLAALAPVMTKRMDEAKINISGVGAAQYDKDSIISIFTGAEGEDKEFNLPSDVNMVKVTMIGGGGAGGNSFFGKQEVTTSKSWTVPEGVSKLRVFMLGGGGGGASGGLGTGTAKIPAGGDGNTYKDFLTAGEHTFTIPNTATKVPDLNPACAASGLTTWTGVTDGKEYTPGKVAISVTACGGGGGGGGTFNNATYGSNGGGGGSGGYVQNVQVQGSLPSTVYVKIGGGGGGGGVTTGNGLGGGYYAGGGGGGGKKNSNEGNGGTYGGSGGAGASDTANGAAASGGSAGTGTTLSNGGGYGAHTAKSTYAGNGGSGALWGGGGGGGGMSEGGGGGGGGGMVTISTASGNSGTILFQIGGGGGGGGGGAMNGYDAAGGGGGGGGYGAGGGGGGGGTDSQGVGGTGGTSLSGSIGIGMGSVGKNATSRSCSGTVCVGHGGGGGGGYGGASADNAGSVTAGIISNIFGTGYCNGGNGGNKSGAGISGKPGALRLYYTYPELKCDFSLPANGSGGGGAGQLVVGEINVTPGETLYFEIGGGGNAQSAAGKDGNEGKVTRIRRGGPSGAVIVEALGGLAGHYSSAETTESQGGSYRVNTAVGAGQTLDNNWTGVKYNAQSGTGSNGKLANALINKGYGGAGGASQNMKGETLQGGVGGNTVKNGASPDIKSYGAGGGGGSGSQSEGDTTFGIGASGAAGYIYFEYGGTNGGGGTTGELVTKLITNLKSGTVIGINVGEGGDNSTGDGNGGETSITYSTGTDKSVKARGGIRGNDGGMGLNEHAAEKLLPDNYANKSDPLTKGQAATSTYGGIGGYLEQLYENADGTWATYIKAKDGTLGGPILGGCGGNLTTLMAGITCNDAANTPNGKNGVFGGGGGGGAVVNETGGLGGKGGRGMVILEYKSTAL